MKIYIIGAAGSGKTTLAKEIGQRSGIIPTNLDDIFWSNETNSFGRKRNIEERNKIYQKILKTNAWIIEGAYIEWPIEGLYRSDTVIYLDIDKNEINKRIILRFLLRKIGIGKTIKKESISGLKDLIKWNNKQIQELKLFIEKLENENHRIIILRNDVEISKYLEKL